MLPKLKKDLFEDFDQYEGIIHGIEDSLWENDTIKAWGYVVMAIDEIKARKQTYKVGDRFTNEASATDEEYLLVCSVDGLVLLINTSNGESVGELTVGDSFNISQQEFDSISYGRSFTKVEK